MLYTHILQLTQNSSSLIREIQSVVTHFNTPLLWLFWGIMALVYVDLFNNISGTPVKYGFIISKVMFEAFFYSLFFAIWGDVLNQTTFKQRLLMIKELRQKMNSVIQNNVSLHVFHVLSFYFAFNYMIIMYFASWYFTLVYALFSTFIYKYISKYTYNIHYYDNHIYTTNENKINESFDAIIKWEYNSVKPAVQTNNWIIVN